jgi:hypothetical protein
VCGEMLLKLAITADLKIMRRKKIAKEGKRFEHTHARSLT